MSLDDHTKELLERMLRRLKGNDDDNVAGVPARKKPPKHPFGPSTAKARPEPNQ